MVNGIKDFEFQNDCVDFLIDKTSEIGSKQVITVKAPTGDGKCYFYQLGVGNEKGQYGIKR